MPVFGFVYIWYDAVRRKFYVGSHHGNPNDGYVCSSGWMLRAFRKRPETFRRRIVQVNDTIDDHRHTRMLEQRWLQMIKPEELGKRYYNRKRVATGGNLIEGMSGEERARWSKRLSETRSGARHHSARAVIINGIRYPTIRAARDAFGGIQIARRLRSKSLKWREWYFEDEGQLPIEVCVEHDRKQKEKQLEHLAKVAEKIKTSPSEAYLSRGEKISRSLLVNSKERGLKISESLKRKYQNDPEYAKRARENSRKAFRNAGLGVKGFRWFNDGVRAFRLHPNDPKIEELRLKRGRNVIQN